MMSEICRNCRRFDEIRWIILKTLFCRGRIAGPLGAASRLGIPRQTLRIDKHRFKARRAG
jgi:hypothetical protein